MNTKHTKEPWSINDWPQDTTDITIGAILTPLIAKVSLRDVSINEQKDNARRIVACINACEGFSIEELEGADLHKDNIESGAEIIALRQQRDELIAALKRWIWLRDTPAGFVGKCGKALRDAVDEREAQLSEAEAISRAAIDKVVGDTPQKCKCNFRQKTVGDGCAICNPELAADTKDEDEP